MLARSVCLAAVLSALWWCPSLSAQDNYFVTYSHALAIPDTLEISFRSVTGPVKGGNVFVASALEFEYGVKSRWTAELYLDGQSTLAESTVFTGFRVENRIRPLAQEHWINPVIYFEFADINGADKTLLEVVGHDRAADFAARNDRSDRKREVELKLILSSNFKGWNVSENIVAEKNLGNAPWEFGYALGASRQLASGVPVKSCTLCRQNFALGAEIYGGLGDRHSFGLSDTSHYAGPVITWNIPKHLELRFSPTFALNDAGNAFLFRFMISRDFEQFFSRFRKQPRKSDESVGEQQPQ